MRTLGVRGGLLGGSWCATAIAALLPMTATLAADPPPPGQSWGNVPGVALQPPQGAGWGPGGYGARPAPMPGGPPPGAPPPAPGMGMSMAPRPGYPGGPGAGGPGMPPHPGMSSYPGMAGNRGGYAQGGGYARGGGALRRGYRLPGTFLAAPYLIDDWGLYGLTAPGLGYHWIHYYDGAALVDRYGVVQEYRDGIGWGGRGGGHERGHEGYEAGYRDGWSDGWTSGWSDGWSDGVQYAEDAVTYRGKWKRGPAERDGRPGGYPGGHRGGDGFGYGSGYGSGHGYGYAPGYGAPGYASGGATVYSGAGGSTVVVVQGGPAVTTTTTTVEETVSYATHRRVWRKPVHRCRPVPRCACR